MLYLLLLAGCDRPAADVAKVLHDDERNAGITASVTCDELFSCSTLIFDVETVTGSRADVNRVLFQFAETQKERSYDRVYLASKGTKKFYLPGSYFRDLGRDYGGGENPVYLMNHLPENTKDLNGSAAFDTWSGGFLGVATKQMEDLTTLHDRWWASP